jgi:hypothetical protein
MLTNVVREDFLNVFEICLGLVTISNIVVYVI